MDCRRNVKIEEMPFDVWTLTLVKDTLLCKKGMQTFVSKVR
jgi:hypothetical protein